MAMCLRMNRKQKRRGFTLTEIAIVLGIIGLILGAIWAAAAAVYSNMKVNSAERGITFAAQQVHSMFATASGNTGVATDLTAPGMFPPDWNITVGNKTYTSNPWTTSLAQAGGSYAFIDGNGASLTTVGVELDSIDDNGCSALISYFNQQASSDNGGQITGLIGSVTGKQGNGNKAKLGSADVPVSGANTYGVASACKNGTNGDSVLIAFDLAKM